MDGLRGIKTINDLYLRNNELQNVDGLKSIININYLYLNDNPALRISFLPPSLKVLCADVSQLSDFDFKSLPKLQRLYSDSTDRARFRNLPKSVEMKKGGW